MLLQYAEKSEIVEVYTTSYAQCFRFAAYLLTKNSFPLFITDDKRLQWYDGASTYLQDIIASGHQRIADH